MDYSKIISLSELIEKKYGSEKFAYNRDIKYFLIDNDNNAFAEITYILESDMHNSAVIVAIDDNGHDIVICHDTIKKFTKEYLKGEDLTFNEVYIGTESDIKKEIDAIYKQFMSDRGFIDWVKMAKEIYRLRLLLKAQ